MMTYLSEDPTYLAGGLGVVGAICLIALKVTQQGKYLLWAIGLFGAAALVVFVERAWVTDAERIEAVVVELVDATRRSDAEAVVALMTPDARVEIGGAADDQAGPVRRGIVQVVGHFAGKKITVEEVRSKLSQIKFDFLNIGRLTAEVHGQNRRGTAEFRAYASGTHVGPDSPVAYNFATPPAGTDWSLGFREVAPGVWKIDRVSPTRISEFHTEAVPRL